MRGMTFLIFAIATICCWGIYGPVLHIGQELMGEPGQKASLRPFIGVGVAYFLIAVLFPVIVLFTRKEKGHWTVSGSFWSFFAGAVGAIGALGIIMAFKFNGKPFYVMPLVFGCAPVVNTFVTMFMARTFKNASMLFFIGVLLVAVGGAGVLIFKPVGDKPVAPTTEQNDTPDSNPAADGNSGDESESAPTDTDSANSATGETSGESNADEENADEENADEENADEENADESDTNSTQADEDATGQIGTNPAQPLTNASNETQVEAATDSKPASDKQRPLLIALSIAMTALCWGAYGPVLHKGQARMAGSRLRPFICVGLAYFAIAVVIPWFLLGTFPEGQSQHPTSGFIWSMLAGAAGAGGALGIIYAFNFGGKPIYVMPLVFGFAPVVNTLTEALSNNLLGKIGWQFYASLLLVILGAVMVLICAPKGNKPESAKANS